MERRFDFGDIKLYISSGDFGDAEIFLERNYVDEDDPSENFHQEILLSNLGIEEVAAIIEALIAATGVTEGMYSVKA